MRRIAAALMAALLAVVLVVQPLLASAPEPNLEPNIEPSERHYGLTCLNGICRAQLDLEMGAEWMPQGAWLSVMQSALSALPGGAGLALQDDVTITLPTGNLSLADADLVLTLDEAGKIATLRGSASLPVPTFGLFGDWQVVTPARVSLGYDRGDALGELNAPLQPARRYFFLDAEAGLHLLAEGMSLNSDAGQRATLIVDFAQPLVYVDGMVTLRTDGQMAFIREALGPLGESGWLPSELPLRQSVNVHVQGQWGRDVEPSLTVAGGYRMDSGLAGKWLQIDATPLLAQGNVTIAPQGLMLEGSARSALQPEEWFDGGAQAQLFVPFAAPETASLTVGADVASSAVGIKQAATATVAGEAGWLERSGDAAWASVQQGWNQMQSAAQSGYAWLGDGVGSGLGVAHTQWCGWTDLCATEESETEEASVAQEGTRVAAAE